MSYDILAVGDMHLADNSWPGRPLFHDSYFILPQLLAVVNKYQPKKIVLCGDIIDRKRTNSRPISETTSTPSNLDRSSPRSAQKRISRQPMT